MQNGLTTPIISPLLSDYYRIEMLAFFPFSPLQGIISMIALQSLLSIWLFFSLGRQKQFTAQILEKHQDYQTQLINQLQQTLSEISHANQHRIHEQISQGHLSNHQLISETIQRYMGDVREQMSHSFTQHSTSLTAHLHSLTEEIRNHLHSLTQQVNHKLTEGFEKTSSTFTDVVVRLTIIDEAQKKITELSSHVVNLQDILFVNGQEALLARTHG